MIDRIVKVDDKNDTLRSFIFETKTTNPFPTAFSTILLAVHELSFRDSLVLADEGGARRALANVYGRMNTRRDALVPEERRNNINLVKGLVRDCFVTGDVSKVAFGRRRELDIENTLRRSQIGTPSFEIKRGILRLDGERGVDNNVFSKVLQSVCAIANIGREARGMIFIGVADKRGDASRIAEMDGVVPLGVGNRWVVGIDREARALKETMERYYQRWRDQIDNANLSQPLKSDVLSALDMCELKGFHILLIPIPAQKSVSFLDGKVFTRDGDQTVEASPEKIVGISARFGG
jgi:Putative DNA-binding domain